MKSIKSITTAWVSIALSAIILQGCATLQKLNNINADNSKYVSLLPADTVFVVVPFNDYLDQIQFASSIQNALLQAGFNVIEPTRSEKVVEERKSASYGQAGATINVTDPNINKSEAQALRIEKFIVGEDIKADYIVYAMTSGYEGTIRIIRKSDRKIIGVKNIYSKFNLKKEILMYFEDIKLVRDENKK